MAAALTTAAAATTTTAPPQPDWRAPHLSPEKTNITQSHKERTGLGSTTSERFRIQYVQSKDKEIKGFRISFLEISSR
jgi:hypothetical protein